MNIVADCEPSQCQFVNRLTSSDVKDDQVFQAASIRRKFIRLSGILTEFFKSLKLPEPFFILETMNWKTIYITGRPEFQAEVRKKLEHSNLSFMPGYVDNSIAAVSHDLYWLNDQTELREMKEAIGGKLVWKYRLIFHETLESFIQSQDNTAKGAELTQDDLDLMAHMREVA